MPLTTARIGRERTLTTLVRNLFEIGGPDAAETAKRAEAALQRANPRLADRDGFQTGAVLVIPADLGLAAKARADDAGASLSGLLDEAAGRLQAGLAQARDGLARDAEAAKGFIDRLGDDAFRRALISQTDQAERLLDQAKAMQSQALETAAATGKSLASAGEAALAEIARLRKQAAGGAG